MHPNFRIAKMKIKKCYRNKEIGNLYSFSIINALFLIH